MEKNFTISNVCSTCRRMENYMFSFLYCVLDCTGNNGAVSIDMQDFILKWQMSPQSIKMWRQQRRPETAPGSEG